MGRKAWIGIAVALALGALLVWAWIDGGERRVRWIEEPVALPEEVG